MLSTFQLPASNQNASLLMSLPAELRLKILQSLLIANGPLRSIQEIASPGEPQKESWQEFEAQSCLSAQVLWCCQRLYQEGRRVLYGDNVLSLFVGFEWDTYVLEIFNLTFNLGKLQGFRYMIPPMEQGLLEFSRSPYGSTCHADMRSMRSNPFKVMTCFQKFRIPAQFRKQDDVFIFARLLRVLLYQKDVSVSLRKVDAFYQGDSIVVAPPTISDCTINDCLPLRHLRCRSISIHGKGLKSTELAPLIDKIISDDPVYDLWRLYSEFQKGIVQRVPTKSHCSNSRIPRREWSAMCEAAIIIDHDLFERTKESIMNRLGGQLPTHIK